ncbi:GNAT family N-acetyltransferase [Pseudobythopirellula maris]|uniref:GNAT family N-acetyltransferase n=1 Tax=Pseudobythopirellula maris TaxID=2527991 RepID=UPI0011B47997|nr:GNAT family N-acetyltransferase [Pseudobythopirellula maris]
MLSKIYFDRAGLLVATREGEPVGFAHAAFGPGDGGECVDCTLGTTAMLMVRGDVDDPAIADALIGRSEAYQRDRGASVHYAGGIDPLNGFYLGLYGGSEMPGILESDPRQLAAFERNQYQESGRVVVLQRQLVRFRPDASRETRLVRRKAQFAHNFSPSAKNWWDACVCGPLDRMRFSLLMRGQERPAASVTFWDLEPLATSWGIRTMGMLDLLVEPEHRRQRMATYLLNESFRELLKRGVTMIEAQTMADNQAALAFYHKMGFTAVDHGRVLRRAPRDG